MRRKEVLIGKPLFWSRVIGEETKLTKGKFQSKIMGFRETNEVILEGRISIDMMAHMLLEKKLRSYSLNYVSYYFLNEQKEDVAYQMIEKLQNTNSTTRKKIASYCLKDAILALRLFEKLKCIYNYVEMVRVTGVPLKYIFSRGQQIKVLSQLFRKTREVDMIIPYRPVKAESGEVQFEGADVLEPEKGFYTVPIATLDFASLYPSIMISNNLCYTTLLRAETARSLPKEDVFITPNNHCFIRSSVRKGLLCNIMEHLLSARKRVKGELEATKRQIAEMDARIRAAETPHEKIQLEAAKSDLENLADVLDGRQLALKVSANSVYGFTGAGVGSLPCLEIASSVTAIGRQMINKTKDSVMSHFCKANGYPENAQVIYGDTDSVMINFKVADISQAMAMGREAAEVLTKQFVRPVKLEFEKVYFPFLLIQKKRYAGMLYTKPDKPDRKDTKGVESVRRDNCLLVKTMVDKVLDLLLYERDLAQVARYVQGTLQDLNRGKIDISQLIISRSISRSIDGDAYKTKSAHVELARRLRIRDPTYTVEIGDRIPYVILCGDAKAKQYEKAEDPTYAFQKNLAIDLNYYIEDQIRPPLERILAPVMDVRELFEGKHMQAKSNLAANSVLGKFFVKKVQCLKCREAITGGEKEESVPALCTRCLANPQTVLEFYYDKAVEKKAIEEEFGRLWSECQRCEGSMLQEVICSNNDCPIFYRRVKVQSELETLQLVMKRIDNC